MTADADADRFARIDAIRADEVDTKLFDRVLVNEALNQLHPSHREVIRKAYYLGWTTGQIAADLNVTEPLVKSQLHYALHTLRLSLIDPTLRSRIMFARSSSDGPDSHSSSSPTPWDESVGDDHMNRSVTCLRNHYGGKNIRMTEMTERAGNG